MFTLKNAIFSGMLALPLLAACATQSIGSGAGLANPASEYCLSKGGRIEIIRDTGGEKGMCHLSDGTMIEEWALFRRDNPEK